MAARSRRIGSLIGYVLVSTLGVAAGFGSVQALAGADDETPSAPTGSTVVETSSTTTTSTIPVEEIALALADVETVDDAVALIEQAPEAPAPGVGITVGDDVDTGDPVASTAFLVSSADLAELGAPFFSATDGSAPKLPGGDKIVVMVAFSEPIANLDGLIGAVVYARPGQPAFAEGPFTGTTSAVAARFGRPDVIGSFVEENGSFVETAPAGSVRVDGPLVTFVVDPVAPFRVVFARGFDNSLNNFGINPPNADPALAADQLLRLGNVDAFVAELSRS